MTWTTDHSTGRALQLSMFVAAKGRDTFTPNIFSTRNNAKRIPNPS